MIRKSEKGFRIKSWIRSLLSGSRPGKEPKILLDDKIKNFQTRTQFETDKDLISGIP